MKTLIVCQEINSQEQAEVPIQVLMSSWLPHTAISSLQLPHNSVNKYLTPLGMPPALRTKPPKEDILILSLSGSQTLTCMADFRITHGIF